MNLFDIDFPVYCESFPGIFAEPVNFFTNLAFLIAVFFAYKKLKENKVKKIEYYLAFFFIIILGIGSLAWHFYRSNLTFLLDMVPLSIFLFIVIFILLSKFIENKFLISSLILGIAFLGWIVSPFLPFSNSTNYYVVGAVFLFALFVWVRIKLGKIINKFSTPFLIMGFALVLRFLDLVVCNFIPFGTHFLWHILSAISIYLVMTFLIEIERLGVK